MFKELIEYYLGYFQAHGEAAIKTICNCSVPSQIILAEYKKLPPIEMMDERGKEELKLYIRENFVNKTPEQKMDIAKIVYTIGSLL